MPTYNYTCGNCNHKYNDLAKPNEMIDCPECGTPNAPSLPTGGSMQVMETRDSYRGKQVRKNNEGLMKDRMSKHHDKHELADKIDQFGMDAAVKHGWLKKVKRI